MNKKRALALTLSAALASALVLPAQAVGEVVGHIYHTDIGAKIDGHPIRSYNIGGTTVVVAEDLRQYGFDVIWSAGERTLTVERAPGKAADGDYQASGQGKPAGTLAGNILATDIRTYVQGELVESFNIGGETAIRMSDLAVCGDLTWDPETDLADLTLAADPMEAALERERTRLENAGLSYTFDLYPGVQGTLAVCRQNGTSHGTACKMLYVEKNGARTDLAALMPAHGFGAAYYLDPRDIQFSEDGKRLSFYTPVKSEENNETVEWGDTYCVIDLETPSVTRLDRLNQPLKRWESYVTSDHEHHDEETEVIFTRVGAEVTADIKQSSCGWKRFIADSGSFTLYGENTGWWDCEYCHAHDGDEAYQEARREKTAWMNDIPKTWDGDIDWDAERPMENSPELRAEIAKHFQVTWNGELLTGYMYTNKGNGHVDYIFDFDKAVHLSDGDVLRVWMDW